MDSHNEKLIALTKADERLIRKVEDIYNTPCSVEWYLNKKAYSRYSKSEKGFFANLELDLDPDLWIHSYSDFIKKQLNRYTIIIDKLEEIIYNERGNKFILDIPYSKKDDEGRTVIELAKYGIEDFVAGVCYVDRNIFELLKLVEQEERIMKVLQLAMEGCEKLYRGKTPLEYYNQAPIDHFWVYLIEKDSYLVLNNNILKAMGIGILDFDRVYNNKKQECLGLLLFGFDAEKKWKEYVTFLILHDPKFEMIFVKEEENEEAEVKKFKVKHTLQRQDANLEYDPEHEKNVIRINAITKKVNQEDFSESV